MHLLQQQKNGGEMNILSDYASAFKADYGGIVSECHFTFSTRFGQRGGQSMLRHFKGMKDTKPTFRGLNLKT